ncbi:MAG: secretin N-terminal domain-containing protein [Candidatus Omnitrophica bacterium]|nr:secretin N-terminal domain-containing protein [Candidatus Omnitrophota bacterium]
MGQKRRVVFVCGGIVFFSSLVFLFAEQSATTSTTSTAAATTTTASAGTQATTQPATTTAQPVAVATTAPSTPPVQPTVLSAGPTNTTSEQAQQQPVAGQTPNNQEYGPNNPGPWASGQPGMPGTGQPGMGQPGMPGMGQPGMPGMGQPGMAPPPEQPPIEQVNQANNNSTPATPLSDEQVTQGIKVSQERLSLDLKGIDINELFRILSLKMGTTIVPTKSVSGRINIFLNNLSFEDALDVILISQDLASDRKGTIINIMTSGEYEKLYGKKFNEKRRFTSFKLKYAKPSTVFNALSQVKSDIGKVIADEATGTILLIDIPEKLDKMVKTAKDLDKAPQTEVFDIKYAKSSDMKTQLSSAITQGTGEVYVDERSSKVVVSDLPDKMKKISRVVKAFDAETKQVFIEAEILQITLKKEYQRGINWEKLFKSVDWHNLDFKGTFGVNPSFTPSPALKDSNIKINVGTLATDTWTSALQLLETYGDTKIISSPRLAVVNNQEAKILVGSREAYVTQSQSQAETTTVTSENVEFIDVGTKLHIVPTINEEGFITMKIKPEVSSVRETLTTSLGSKIPIVETSEAETVVKIKDGAMILIAGLIKEDKRQDTNGIPVLGAIPFIGGFFGAKANLDKRTEVVVFITPHIIRGDAVLPGTEPQRLIPSDIATESVKQTIVDSIISKEVDESIRKSKQEGSPIGALPLPAESPVADIPGSGTDITGKIKGLKNY